MMSPEDSWVSKWQRISEWFSAPGLGAKHPLSPANPSAGQWEPLVGAAEGLSAPDEGAPAEAGDGGSTQLLLPAGVT